MFGSLGLPEILFILVLALLVFGPRRLPEVGRTIGKALGEFRRATGDLKRTFDQETSAFERDAGLGSAAESPREATPEPVRTEGEPANSSAEVAAEPAPATERLSKADDGAETSEPS